MTPEASQPSVKSPRRLIAQALFGALLLSASLLLDVVPIGSIKVIGILFLGLFATGAFIDWTAEKQLRLNVEEDYWDERTLESARALTQTLAKVFFCIMLVTLAAWAISRFGYRKHSLIPIVCLFPLQAVTRMAAVLRKPRSSEDHLPSWPTDMPPITSSNWGGRNLP